MVIHDPSSFEEAWRERRRKHMEEQENEWKRSRFGDGPFDPVMQALIDEVMSIRERLRQLDSRTFMLQTF